MSYTSKYTGAEIDARLDKMLNVTWQELKDLRDAGNLIAGQMYRMTDYETMTSQEGTQQAGHPFDLILTALSKKALDEKCSAIWSERDTDGYFANSNLPAWDVRYCLDNDKRRFGWAVRKDKIIQTDDYDAPQAVLNGQYEFNGEMYYRWDVGDSFGTHVLSKTDSPSIGDEVIINQDAYPQYPWDAKVTGLSESTNEGKGVIYKLVDEFNNDIPYDFKNILFKRKMTNGEYDDNGTESLVYTFNYWNGSESSDFSLDGEYCTDNVMIFYKILSNIVFLNSGTKDFCFGNTFAKLCENITLGRKCWDNSFAQFVTDRIIPANTTGNRYGKNNFVE